MFRWIAALVLAPLLASAQEAFQLPTGSIHCAVFDGRLRCDVLNFAHQRPPRPRGCDLDDAGAVAMAPAGLPALICHGDTIATPTASVLGYGQAWQGGGMACLASPGGLRCVNAQGHGFEMARARLLLF